VERAHVVGVSMGGAIAQHLVLKAPERVRSLVLAVTWPGPSPWRARVRDLQLAVAALGSEHLVRLRVLLVFSPPFVNENPDFLEPIEETMMQTPLEGYLAHIDACETHDLRARLGEIRTPTLTIAAARDVLVPPELTREVAALIPGAELVTLDTAHAVQLEGAGGFNKRVLDFLERH
jgi:3-oxoadipate enol-lactonase